MWLSCDAGMPRGVAVEDIPCREEELEELLEDRPHVPHTPRFFGAALDHCLVNPGSPSVFGRMQLPEESEEIEPEATMDGLGEDVWQRTYERDEQQLSRACDSINASCQGAEFARLRPKEACAPAVSDRNIYRVRLRRSSLAEPYDAFIAMPQGDGYSETWLALPLEEVLADEVLEVNGSPSMSVEQLQDILLSSTAVDLLLYNDGTLRMRLFLETNSDNENPPATMIESVAESASHLLFSCSGDSGFATRSPCNNEKHVESI